MDRGREDCLASKIMDIQRSANGDPVTYQRAKQEDPMVINQWFETVHEAIQGYGIHGDDIWNFDEGGFAMELCSTSRSSLR
ncbi:uncharacterized protein N7515_001192 [Penicillium bovifimosum]|uniref:Uncharacterized protein n=1 Tax=Penicillium bovifimosum TaxID=126998 RepID=A0A9W9HH44_9EURO|nr:uncharacterized protein N7515_001192 [Penicillium bovifimosum]KAJ5146628.1 hypothetical protein N7515_001192 [Penicillium bovifimosum]